MACPHPHPLDVDLSPVAKAQVGRLQGLDQFGHMPVLNYL